MFMFTPTQARTIIAKARQPEANLTLMFYNYLYDTDPAMAHRLVRELSLLPSDGKGPYSEPDARGRPRVVESTGPVSKSG